MSEKILVRIIGEVMSLPQTADPSSRPPEIVARMHTLIRNLTKCEDPYLGLKQTSTGNNLDLPEQFSADAVKRSLRNMIKQT